MNAFNKSSYARWHHDHARAKGVRLHYLDWGGSGEAILFLTSRGGTADDFHPLAISLTDRYRALGLTRRGQGQSEKPASHLYDIPRWLKISGLFWMR